MPPQPDPPAGLIRGTATHIPLKDRSVSLVVTSPPYFALRSYQDDGEHYAGQIGSEPDPIEFLCALWAVLDECWRVLEDNGSAWINLGDKYAGGGGFSPDSPSNVARRSENVLQDGRFTVSPTLRKRLKTGPAKADVRAKSLMGLPWRFALGLTCPALYRAPLEPSMCWHDDGPGPCHTCRPRRFPQWVGRAETIWAKLNGLPEGVTDRPRRSHEQWFMVTKSGRYFAGIDEIREPAVEPHRSTGQRERHGTDRAVRSGANQGFGLVGVKPREYNPLGKLPGSVWSIPSAPLAVPDLWLSDDRRSWRAHGEPTRNAERKTQLRREVWEMGEKAAADGRPLYVKGVIDHFACVDTETEILTTRGWLRHDQLAAGDTVAGYNLDLGRAEWTGCHGVHRYEYDGLLVAVEKRGLSMWLTPNHRVLAEKRYGAAGHRGPLSVVRADELVPGHFIPQAAEWEPYERKAIGADLAALLGWVAAEGWVRETGDVCLSQSLSVNSEHVAKIDALLASSPAATYDSGLRGVSFERGKYRARMQVDGRMTSFGTFDTRVEAVAAVRAERDRRGLDALRRSERTCVYRGREWVNVEWRLPRGLGDQVRRLLPDKLLTWDMVGLPENERRALLDAFIDGDGHRRPGRAGIYQKRRENLDVLQAIAVTLGYRTRLTTEANRFVLYLTSGGRSVTLRGTNGSLSPIPTEHYQGTVWCPTTGTGTFIARRDGKVFITGNSFPPSLPQRIIAGWSPTGICTTCGEGRVPVVEKGLVARNRNVAPRRYADDVLGQTPGDYYAGTEYQGSTEAAITGYACACPDPSAPTRPAVVLDPFSGTGTVAMMARAMGRMGVGLDLSWDYTWLARWRVFESGHGEKALAKSKAPTRKKPPDSRAVPVPPSDPDQLSLL